MPFLRVIEGAEKDRIYELADQPITLGREPSNPICLADVKASRVHAEIACQDGRWLLKDLGSSNGTWSEAGRVPTLPLSDGVTFRIGRTWLRFEERDPSDTLPEGPGGETVLGLDRVHSSVLFDPKAGGGGRDHAYLALLHHIVLQSHQARGRDELFDILDDGAAEALEGDRVAVFLPAEDGWSLWPPHEKRLRARWGAVPFARTLLAEPRLHGEPLLVVGAASGDLKPSPSMVLSGVQSAMAAPLRIGDEVHALLYVDRVQAGKPFTRTDLEFLNAVANQLAVQLTNRQLLTQLQGEVAQLREHKAPAAAKAVRMVGSDEALAAVQAFIAKAAPTTAPVLVLGESGTGKELVARAVHAQSRRADKPLQVVNCAAIAESLVEATLFGHVKGAFTGADETRPGVFELADGATLFLDEIGELPLGVQAKLLRALEQGEMQRVGDGALRRVDVRLIAATNRDLAEESRAGRFREDLYHRLNVLSVALPPLRSRPGDLDTLIDHFLVEHARRLSQDPKRLSPEARTVLIRYGWPGNIRQLKNVLERASILAVGALIQVSDLPPELREVSTTVPIDAQMATLAAVERGHILRVLERCQGNKKQAAEILAIDRSTLYAKLKQYGVQ